MIGQGAEEIEGWTDRNDLLIENAKPLVIYGGHTRRAKFVATPFVPGPNVRILEPRDGLDARFLFYFLSQLEINERGYADHFPLVRKSEVPVPPLDEQMRIVAVLDQAFAALDQARANIEARAKDLVDLKQSVLKHFLKPRSGRAIRWKRMRLGDLFDIGSSRRVMQSDWRSSGVPFYRAREIVKLAKFGRVENELFISEDHFHELGRQGELPRAGDLMVSGVGTLGACYVVKEADRFYYKDASVLCLRPVGEVVPEFARYLFQWEDFLAKVNDGEGATVGTLTIGRARSIEIELPPIDDQTRIVGMLDNFFREVEALQHVGQAQLTDLAALRQSLLQAAFSGQLN